MHKIIDKLLALLEAARKAGPRIEAALKARLVANLEKLHDKITAAERAAKAEAGRLVDRAQDVENKAIAKAEAELEKLYALADKHGVEV
ncbi:hypothetical protein [Robbsia andropogonis]|uniref:hypothetical protein n=1 Tax=Robbsia andropogonis TaxID=28092 RepID=UPI002A69D09C|nr:hypothetical protein [Robbsia andropogonis]